VRAGWRRMAATLRQHGFPPEFRIDESGADGFEEDDLNALLALVAERERARGEASVTAAPEPLDPAVVRRLANVTWNLMGQAQQLGETTFDRALRGRIDILTQALEDARIELIDYTGQDYDEGEIWDEVIGAEGRKLQPAIVAMNKPRVRYRGVVVQRGIPVVEDRQAGASGGAAG
jgi:hypothetical protein